MGRGSSRRLGRLALGLSLLLSLVGCATDLGHLARAVAGHVSVLQSTRPVDDWIVDPSTPDELRQRLALAREIRTFAVTHLALPDNASYQRYGDLQRDAVVWNVVAAPELSLALKSWCYPVVGCVGYRGYFELRRAQDEARMLQSQGWEVHLYGVPAYSTLGWTNWLGGDPLLNTFALGSPIELARLVFHELAHQVAYALGDMAFSESYATAVEQLGLAAWAQHASAARVDAAQWARWQRRQGQREQWRALLRDHKAELEALYRSRMADEARRQRKQHLQAELQQRYAALRDGAWGGDRAFDPAMAGLNNAVLALQGSYHDQVGAFMTLFDQHGRDFARWHQAVRELARLPDGERARVMQALQQQGSEPRTAGQPRGATP